MQEIKVINGTSYTFEVTENELFARELCAQYFAGYRLTYESGCYTTTIFKEFGFEKKNIGKVQYDPDTKKFILWKFIDETKHKMKKTDELGINGALFAKLRVGDYIHFKVGKKKLYKIRVEKAIKVGNYKNFKHSGYNSELQFFIPFEALKEIEE